MSTQRRKKEKDYTDQLSDFESQLRHTLDDQSLQQDVFRAIRDLMQTHKQSESDIREILRQRYASGQLREETLRTVQQMLDRVSDELDDTLPDEVDEPKHSRTDVLPRDATALRKPDQQLQSGSVLRDRFLLQHRVAGGSMGEVYKALDRRLAEVAGVEPWVAIKVLNARLSRNAAALRALQQEAAKGRSLSHPNIVRFVDIDREDDLYFLVMEWIDGQSLAAILDAPDSRKLPLEQVISIVDQLGDALDYAHRRGVVHADVKPGNVMLDPDDHVKLIDFGIARVRQTDADPNGEHDPKIPGAVTPAYSSMQVLTGEEPVPADDVFSLACLTYRLLAGYRVFGPRNAAEAASEGMAPQRPQGISDPQWKVLKKALAFSRVTRFSSARGFADDFIAAARQGPAATAATARTAEIPPQTREQPEHRQSGGGLLKVAVAMGVLAAAAGVAVTQTDVLDRLGIQLPDEIRSLAGRSAQPPPVALDPAPVESQTAVPAAADVPDAAVLPSPSVAEALEDRPDPDADSPAPLPETPASASPAVGDIGAGEIDRAPGSEAPETEMAESEPAANLDDSLAPATHLLLLGAVNGDIPRTVVTVREDGEGAVVDLMRDTEFGGDFLLNVEERLFDGNGSPWESGQYQIAGDGSLSFAAGRTTTQLRISMSSDPLREPDRRAELVLRDALTGAELGIIDLRLEDDDQRRFEAQLPPNTVGFAVSQVSVAEGETAAQIDLVRYKPDETALRIAFDVQDVTATGDEDYFAPASRVVEFGPGERAARILIPLVQDTNPEADEAFFLELAVVNEALDGNLFRRIAVMIRDDD